MDDPKDWLAEIDAPVATAGDWLDDLDAPIAGDAAKHAAGSVGRGLAGTAAGALQSLGLFWEGAGKVARKLPKGSALRALGELEGDTGAGEAVQGYAQAVRDVAAKALPEVERLKDSFLLSTGAEALGSGLGFLLPGGLLKLAGVPAWASTMTLGAAVQGASQFEDARISGAPEEDQWKAWGLGLFLGQAEVIPIARILNRADKASGGALRHALIDGVVEGGEEFLQESGSQLASNAIAAHLLKYDEDRKVWEGVLKAGAGGAFAGVMMSGLATAVVQARVKSHPTHPTHPTHPVRPDPPDASDGAAETISPAGSMGTQTLPDEPSAAQPTGRTVAEIGPETAPGAQAEQPAPSGTGSGVTGESPTGVGQETDLMQAERQPSAPPSAGAGTAEPPAPEAVEEPASAETVTAVGPESAAPETEADDPTPIVAEDIPRELAMRAHGGTSHTPEKRVKAHQDDYLNAMRTAREKLAPLGTTPEKLRQMLDELERYRQGYLKRVKAQLGAMSRVMSPMITGPANFPVARNQKAGRVADKRTQELSDYKTQALAGAVKRLTADQRAAKTAEKYPDRVARDLDFSEGTVRLNVEADRIQLLYEQKPDAETIQSLRRAGFKWAPSVKAWQRQWTPNAEAATERLLGVKLAAPAAAPETSNPSEAPKGSGLHSPEAKAKRAARKKKALPAPPTMTAAQINKELDRLEAEDAKLTDAFIDAGRGSERPSDRTAKADPLSVRSREIADRLFALRFEAQQRYGPGFIGRLPSKGFGRRATPEAMAEMAEDREAREREQAAPAKAEVEEETSYERLRKTGTPIISEAQEGTLETLKVIEKRGGASLRGAQLAIEQGLAEPIKGRKGKIRLTSHGRDQLRRLQDLSNAEASRVDRLVDEEFSARERGAGITSLHAGPPLTVPAVAKGAVRAFFNKHFRWHGGAPREAGQALERARGFSDAELSEIADRARALDKAVAKEHGHGWRAKPVAREIDAAFEDPAKLAALPIEIAEPLAAMRAHTDRMSRLMIQEGAVDPQSDLAETILGNIGTYSKREYRAFSDIDHADKVSPEIRQRFLSLLVSEGKSEEDAHAIMEAILQEAKEVAANPFAQIASSKLGRKDLSIFKRRKDVPPELRALLGEIEDPIANYANSVMRMAQVVAKHVAYRDIRAQGLAHGWLSEPAAREPGHSATLSKEGNPALGPLDGMHTTPEIKKALTQTAKETAKYLRALMIANSAIKWGKVLGQPTAFARNLLSNLTISVANGHLPLWTKLEAWKHAFGKGALGERKRLIRLGILGDGINSYEWNDLRSALKQTPDQIVRAQRGLFDKTKEGVERVYATADNLPKIIGFYAEETALIDAGLSPESAERVAADRIRDLYPTPERMAQGAKAFRRQPFLGQYFAFRAELFRTLVHRLELIRSELKSENPKIRRMGVERLIGQAIAASLTPALVATFNMLNGIDGDEDDDRREFLPPWDLDSQVIWFGDELKGWYTDLSDIDPQTMFTDPIMRVANGTDPKEAVLQWLKDQGMTFFGPSPISKLAVQVYATAIMGQNREIGTGRPIDDLGAYVWKEIQPGVISWFNRERGTGFEPASIASFALARRYDYDVEKSLSYDVFDFSDAISEASAKATRMVKKDKAGAKDIRAKQDDTRREAFAALQDKVQAAQRLGLDRKAVWKMLDQTLSAEVSRAILAGHYIPYKVSKTAPDYRAR